MTTTRLYLIRHGQSFGNADEIMVGSISTDLGLTDLGRAQAAMLRDRIAATGEISADVLMSSTLPRARQTAEIIAPALGLEPSLDDELQELRCGEGEGLSYREFTERYGHYLARSPTEPADPGGEAWSDFSARVGRALDKITAEHAGKSIVIACHGGVISAAMFEMFGMSRTLAPPVLLHTGNASITEWSRDESTEPLLWRLVRFNDEAHCPVRDGSGH